VALAWLLDRPAVTTVIVSACTTEQLLDNLGPADLSLTTDELARLEQVSRPPLLYPYYPYWHQAKTAAGTARPTCRCSAPTWTGDRPAPVQPSSQDASRCRTSGLEKKPPWATPAPGPRTSRSSTGKAPDPLAS
jgi:hypothetical protein